MARRFKSANSYQRFAGRVLRSARYFHDAETEDFFSALIEQGADRAECIAKGTILWRAQLGSGDEPIFDDEGEIVDTLDGPFPPERMKPLRDIVESPSRPQGTESVGKP